jgi:hypothetical protein
MNNKVRVTGLDHCSKAVMRRCIRSNAKSVLDFVVSIGHGAVGSRPSLVLKLLMLRMPPMMSTDDSKRKSR